MRNNIKIYDLDMGMTDFEPKAIALGNFDGVHIGHQKLIGKNIEIANRLNLVPSVLLFKENSKKTLIDEKNYLTSLDDKIEILAKMGMDTFCILEFNEEFRSLSPKEFISKILYQKLNSKYIVVGEDYHFGKNAQGNVDTLKQNQDEFGFETKIVDFELDNGKKISSTDIKQLIKEGNIKLANKYLARPYKIIGHVIDGHKRGRTLNFPTANLKTNFSYTLPKDGVYLTRVNVKGKNYFALSNVGSNPTFGNDNRKVETYILDFDQDIYGENISIEFLEFFRDDMKFNSADELIDQMETDKQLAIDAINDKYL
ncbi:MULTISPECIES: bifunctional riboflavin kinase/FAD synthetase [Anaerococcus]|uniref:Riboflavin biosynthesis protein n=1 Tax=Anaerococcus octavius TaxID=54007 RepID=A0A2I1M4X6_9FIRM|nr:MULTISPECIES: bifunctional riboflavin kinase/FAD synthetase [Anaerococcus]MBS6106402.1 bifunctional riboflavin kinase/FAD synthetase [Anaerococcus sp.]MDU2599056.1 bifunctional riboflavin kinase/FAD synthetase [Anaerococcus sp.]MDU3176637.1 bifunctional riboflavin kinase/FAD synthetase [Anaerococcus sp.]MDU4025654.1 bifunctional riboflavin kinase/FAD synthetase [Anaerococcus sp.]MDU5534663.1 bifunctional riboflavin kinase/FAD synthetase [Anaerococcus sp.]